MLKPANSGIVKLTNNLVRKLWREAVLKAAGYKCQYPGCECTKALNAHHIIDKQISLLKYAVVNGLALCFYHHKMGLMSAHKNPFFIKWMIKLKMITQERVDELEEILFNELARMARGEKPRSIHLIREEAYNKLI
jgi:hypothetical protein